MGKLVMGLLLVLGMGSAVSGEPENKGEDPLGHVAWRNIGPPNMSGRVADVEGVPGNPKIVYVGSASGGVWKTENGGITFKPIFDDQPISSIGDLALAPTNPDVIYVGSGEGNTRNSVSFGNGVYGSTDGGAHWTHLGLEETHHISRVLVHPSDPNTVFVAAIGHIFGPHEQRGVFKSSDGGKTWHKVLYIDERHGAADMDLNPHNPNVVFAGMWLFERKPWTHTSGSEEGGLFKSIDGGETWRKIGKGLPKLMGRIAVKVAPSNPKVVYVMAETNEGVLFRSEDGGESFSKINDQVSLVSRGFYYTDLRVDPTDENRVYSVSSRLYRSLDGGKNFDRFSASTHVDYHSLWIDPQNPDRMWQGQDGGIAVSYDRGDHWEPIRNMILAQFYQIYADNREPFYYVGGGLQDNGAWYGPVRTREPAGILSDDWRMVSFGDAYFMHPHPDQPEYLISESQGGGIVRTDMRTRAQEDISPQARRNDGGPVGELPYRFSWNAPIVGSAHEKETVYFCGNVVFKSEDFGDNWTRISDDLTTNDPAKTGEAGGPVWRENTTAEYHCSIISFAESEVKKGVLWAGSDDGLLHLSRNGGKKWKNLTESVGMPAFSPVSHVEPSRTKAAKAYVAYDRHMFDDFAAYIFKTTNSGKTWQRVTNGLPDGAWVWVVREDPKNPKMLYAGTELGLFASYDEGEQWQKLHLKNLPTVAIHDLLIHPRDNDIVLGSHGRGLWVFDDATPLQNFNEVAAAGKVYLFETRQAWRFPVKFTRYGMGDKKHRAPNPPYGALISYYLPEKLEPPEAEDKVKEARVKIEIFDGAGQLVKKIRKPEVEAGLNRVSWALDGALARPRKERQGGNEFRGPARGPYVVPGTYKVRLTVDGKIQERAVEVRMDPNIQVKTADLIAQHKMVSDLRDMISAVNDMLRISDSLSAQLKERETALKSLKMETGEECREAIKSFQEVLRAMQGNLAKEKGKTFWSQGNSLVNNLDELSDNVNGAFRGPSAAQQSLFKELKGELAEAHSSFNRLMETDLVALNKALAGEGASALFIAKP